MPNSPKKVVSEVQSPALRSGRHSYETRNLLPLYTTKKSGVRQAREVVGRFIAGATSIVSEVIGRFTLVKPLWDAKILINEDAVWQDLKFYDYFRYGLCPGYELASLYAKPIVQTLTSYIIGNGITGALAAHAVTDNDNDTSKKPLNSKSKKIDPSQNIQYTNAALRRMFEGNQAFFYRLINDSMSLGDQYVVINPDCTFSVPSPETVTVQYADSDYRLPVRYIIKTKLINSMVEDEYTANQRTLTIRYYDTSQEPEVFKYENLLGRIPIVHFSHERAVNERYGHSLFEPLMQFFREYDDLLVKTINGVKLIGNPIPVFEGLEDPNETIARMSDVEQYVDWQGNTQTRNVLRFDRNSVIFLGKGGKSAMLGPQVGFTTDAIGVLKYLQLIMYHHCRIPEFLMGGAISSSKASVETQMPPFVMHIQSRRLQFEGQGSDSQLNIPASGGLLELAYVWLLQYRILNPAIVVGPVAIEWATIGIENEQYRFLWGQYLSEKGFIDAEDTVRLSGEFDDPAATVAKAQGGTSYNPDFADLDALLDQEQLHAMQDESNLDKRDDVDDPPFNAWAMNNDSSSVGGKIKAVTPKTKKNNKTPKIGPKGEIYNDDYLISGSTNWVYMP